MSCEIKSEDQKVFCVNCAYFNACRRANARRCYDGNYSHETCNAPQNIRPTYMSDGSNKYVSSPSIINQYNNCKWFLPNRKPTEAESLVDEHNKNHSSHPFILEKISNFQDELDRLKLKLEIDEENTFDLNTQEGMKIALFYILTKLGVSQDNIAMNDSDE